MRGIRILLALLVPTLLVFPFLPANAQGKSPNPVGLRPDAPEYAKHGPFWVGYKPLVISDETTRTKLDAHIWYPAVNSREAKEEITYKVTFKLKADGLLGFPKAGDIHGHA